MGKQEGDTWDARTPAGDCQSHGERLTPEHARTQAGAQQGSGKASLRAEQWELARSRLVLIQACAERGADCAGPGDGANEGNPEKTLHLPGHHCLQNRRGSQAITRLQGKTPA